MRILFWIGVLLVAALAAGSLIPADGASVLRSYTIGLIAAVALILPLIWVSGDPERMDSIGVVVAMTLLFAVGLVLFSVSTNYGFFGIVIFLWIGLFYLVALTTKHGWRLPAGLFGLAMTRRAIGPSLTAGFAIATSSALEHSSYVLATLFGVLAAICAVGWIYGIIDSRKT